MKWVLFVVHVRIKNILSVGEKPGVIVNIELEQPQYNGRNKDRNYWIKI